MTRPLWDRDWKNAALTAIAYALLAATAYFTILALSVVARSTGDAPAANGEPRSGSFGTPPASTPYGADPAPDFRSGAVRDGGHKC